MQAPSVRLDLGPSPSERAADWRSTRGHYDHAVQFYERDDFLIELVATFVADGLTCGQSAIVVATAEHVALVRAELSLRGIDVDRHCTSGSLILLDARETLATFMVDGMPDDDRFRAAADAVLERSAACAERPTVRAYGEMVDLLCCDGNAEAAIRLEELWNELAEWHDFALFCSYRLQGFHGAARARSLEHICRTHTSVRPTERFGEGDDETRLVEIALLQHRAHALETELYRRERVETKLRDSVIAAERAKATAEHANRAKSRFLTVMGHELRTPLNAIGGYAELLDMGIHGSVTDDQRDALFRIRRSQGHLLGLINQVLNYAKLETRIVQLDIVDVPVADVLRIVETLALPRITARELRYVQDCGPFVVRADRDNLHQVLLELLMSAAKFTDEHGTVFVDAIGDAATVSIRVSATGSGIPDEKLATIFDPFTEVDTSYTHTRDGIGLGLAISRDLARAMHGDLTVKSAVGAGATFTLALPRADR